METTLAAASSQGISAQHDEATPAVSPSKQALQKRNRTQLSCTNCRHAKLKCDRKKPYCSQCAKKGKASLCTFPSPAPRRKPTVSLQNRLKHLESLVKDVMTGQSPSMQPVVNGKAHQSKDLATSAFTNDHSMLLDTPVQTQNNKSATAPPSGSSGQILFGSSESMYIGATHWAAMLEDIDEMKTYLNEEVEESDEDDNLKPYTSLVFNAQSPSSKSELLAALPQRSTVDLFVSQYFNSNSPALHIIHRPTFQKNYRKFWADPESSPIIFLGLLYSIMMIANIAVVATGEEIPESIGSPSGMIRTFRESCVQCLILSNYTKPGPYTMETLFLYMEVDFLLSKDEQIQAFLLVGNAVRLALRMGLHRDSTKVGGNISPFQAEMRRRQWHHLVQIDLLSSFHLGLPGMIQTVESDTLLPQNLRDEDFDEDCAEPPQPRPDSEITPVSYTICKSRLCQEAGKIVALANRLSLPDYEEVIKLEGLLQAAYQKVPPAFLLDSTGPSITDPPGTTIKRFSLAILFQKSRCMLHRKHLMEAEKREEFKFSRSASLESAMELLHCQSMVHEAALPGGPLSRDRWFLSSLSMHDFLLAAMIVYLTLFCHALIPGQLADEQQAKINALEKSRAIWNETWSIIAEAKKAAVVLEIMLKKLYLRMGDGPSSRSMSTFPMEAPEEARVDKFSKLTLNDKSVSHSQIVDTLLPSGSWAAGGTENTTPSSGHEMPVGFDFSSAEIEPLGAMFDVPNDFDWEMFDNQLRPQDGVEQAWPDLVEEFANGNDDYYNV